MKRLDLINKRLREKNEARLHFNNVDKAMLEHYQVFAKQTKPLPPEPQLSDFYHPSEDKKNSELLFLAVGTGLATYSLYRYLKQMTDEEKLYGGYYQLDCLWAGGKAIKELHKNYVYIEKKYLVMVSKTSTLASSNTSSLLRSDKT